VFNGEETIYEALESIRQQTYESFECIVFDDGSTDTSVGIIEKFVTQDERFVLLKSERIGLVPALNEAIGRSKGMLLARMDADDVSYPNRLELQVRALEKHPDWALVGGQVKMIGDVIGSGRTRYEKWLNEVTSPEDVEREMFIECALAHPTWMIRRTAFDAIGGYRVNNWPEDYDVVLRLYETGKTLGKVDEVILDWREHVHRFSMKDGRYSLTQFRDIKRYFLLRTVLSERKPFFQWGAGDVGKAWLREWGDYVPQAVVDIHPGKIGKTIHGVLVIAPEDLPPPSNCFFLVAVGAPGAREEIRSWANENGYKEGLNFLFVA
jgi:glycosyltransferase involved in cell wall biosynthesis